MLKKQITFIYILLLLSSCVYAETMFIRSKKANMMKSPSMKSRIISKLKHGQKVTVLNKKSLWAQVQFNNKSGWICKFELSQQNPKNQSVISKLEDINLKTSARKRASAYSTAATTRGLSEKNKKVVLNKDYVELKKMESLSVQNSEINQFIKEGKLK